VGEAAGSKRNQRKYRAARETRMMKKAWTLERARSLSRGPFTANVCRRTCLLALGVRGRGAPKFGRADDGPCLTPH